MAKLFDLVKVNIATTGTGTVTFGSVFSPEFFTPSEVGAADGDTVRYVLIDGTNIELGTGVIGGSVTTMTRTVTRSRVGGVAGTSALNLSGTAYLALTAAAADIANPAVINTFTDTTDSTSSTTGSQTLAGGLGVAKDINWGGAALTTYTPTQSGTATGTAAGWYKKFGKLLFIDLRFAATSTGSVILSMPSGLTGPLAVNNQFLLGWTNATGNMVFGYTATNGGTITIKTPTFTDPATNGTIISISGVFYVN